MIHIATVHWKTDKWIDIQLSYIEKHFKSDYRVYAFLNDVPGSHSHKFYYTNTEPIDQHAIKLNLLAERIGWNGKDEDIIVFLDGDAFPISDDIEPFLRSKVEKHKVIAIQRVECDGDLHPHPSFCATTIGFWRQINGDWKMGHSWKDARGLTITDVGGNLYLQLTQLNINWLPLRRSNKKNLHNLWFGIYENLIYHHGAGFRIPISRIDRVGFKANFIFNLIWFFKTLVVLCEKSFERVSEPIIEENQGLDKAFFSEIQKDPFFYKNLS